MIVLFSLGLSAQAASLVVDPGDSAAYPSVGAAITAAASGDTLAIAAGTYRECLDTAGKSLRLEGDGAVTLDSAGCGYALNVDTGETVALSDLILTGDRGLYVASSTVSLTRVTATGLGDSAAYGGALEAYTSAITLQDCRFEGNLGVNGGAIFLAWYNDFRDTGSVYSGNSATGNGGAIYTGAYDVLTLDGVTFEDNRSPGGGALLIAWASGLTVRDSRFVGNRATGAGGAAYLYAVDPTATIDGSTFEENQAGGNGGALELEWYTELSITDSQFTGNEAGDWGGALFTYGLDRLDVVGSLFCANRAGTGGAMGIQWTAADSLTNSLLVENQAAQGGAVYRYASGAGTWTNNSLVGNVASDWGGAYFAGWYAYGRFSNNLVVGSSEGTGFYASDPYDYGYSILSYNGWSENAPLDAGGYFYVAEDLDGNVLADPLLVRWTANGDCSDDDLRLASGSPMRDAGDPAVLDRDGSRSDIGAWGGPDGPVEDLDGDGADTTADCDDSNPDIGPGQTEICDGLDNDCDGQIDGEGAVDAETWYVDWDGDGYGEDATAATGCDPLEGGVAAGGDCDDQNPFQSPGVAEVCGDGFDQDCSGEDAACDTGDPVGAPQDDPRGCGCQGAPGGGLLAVGLGLLGVARRRAVRGGSRARRLARAHNHQL